MRASSIFLGEKIRDSNGEEEPLSVFDGITVKVQYIVDDKDQLPKNGVISSKELLLGLEERKKAEADRIKYDCEFLFIAANSFHDIDHDSNEGENYIRIMQRNEKGEMNPIQNLTYSDVHSSDQQLYLHDNTLAILNFSPSYFSFPIANDMAATVEPFFYYGDNEFELSLVDVSRRGSDFYSSRTAFQNL